MKILILSLVLLFSTIVYSQDKIYIGIYQDPKLAVLSDDYGNKPYTLDIKADVRLQGYQKKSYYYEMRVQYEYADLYGGKFSQWQIMGGWVLNKLIVDNFEIGVYPTIGLLHRFDSSWLSYGGTSEIAYNIGKFKIGWMQQLINRPDVDKWGFSTYLGVAFNVK